jgi:hypothetical protein
MLRSEIFKKYPGDLSISIAARREGLVGSGDAHFYDVVGAAGSCQDVSVFMFLMFDYSIPLAPDDIAVLYLSAPDYNQDLRARRHDSTPDSVCSWMQCACWS